MTARPVLWWSRWRAVGSAKFHVPCSMARDSPLPKCGLDHIAAPGSWLIPANHQSISATGIMHLTSLFSRLDRHE